MAKFNVEYKVVTKSETGVETRQSKAVLEGVMLTHLADLIKADAHGDVSLDFLTIRRQPDVKPKPVVLPKVGGAK
jgi:hypothetical protein